MALTWIWRTRQIITVWATLIYHSEISPLKLPIFKESRLQYPLTTVTLGATQWWRSKIMATTTVSVKNPASASGYVSLLVKAWDSNGSQVEQTTIKAYGVR